MANGLFGTGIGAPQLRQAQLQPAAIPGSAYVRPQQYEVGGNARALASALGSLNSALQGFAAKREQEEKDPNSDMNREWIAKRQQMTLDQLREEARNGTPDGIRARQDALDALIGEQANADFRTRWLEFYNTEFDQSLGDAGAAYNQMRAEFAETLPSEIARGNFYRLTSNHYEQWMQEDTKQKVAFVQEKIGTAVVSSFRTASEDLAASGASAQERAAAVFAMSAENRDFLEMSGQQQNDTIFSLAAEYAAKGDKEMVRALLEGQRVGSDGKALPPLMASPKYATDSLKLIDQAEGKWAENAKEGSLSTKVAIDDMVRAGTFTEAEATKYVESGLYTEDQLSGLVTQSTNNRMSEVARFQAEDAKRNQRFQSEQEEQSAVVETLGLLTQYRGISRIKDVDVIAREGDGYRTVTAKSLIEQATGLFESQTSDLAEGLLSEGRTPEEVEQWAFSRRAAFYGGNKLDNPEWADTLNGIASRATPETLLERGNVSQEMLKSAELYRQLKAANPAYLNTLLDDPDAKRFLEAYDRAVTNKKSPPEDALHFAAATIARPDNERARNYLHARDAEEMATRLMRDMGLDERGMNYAAVQQRIEDMSWDGATKKEIEQGLRKDIEDTSVVIHGVLVPDHRDLPDDFPVLMEKELQAAFEVFGPQYGLESVEDLAIEPVSGQSKWRIVNKTTGQPIGGSYVTPQSLQVQRTKAEREHDAIVLQTIRAKDAERAEAQRIYNERIQYERDQIAKWRAKSGKLSGTIADYLEGVLNDRLARDEWLRTRTPEQLEKEFQEHLEQLRSKVTTQMDGTGL